MKIHFIGIGGIGISALANYYLTTNHRVSGSDIQVSEITKTLQEKGAQIFIGKHRATNITKNIDLIVHSLAIEKDNLELKIAKKYKIKIQPYPEALGSLTKKYFTIAIAGMHGKSTVTALLSLILIKAGLDPTVGVGTKIKEFDDSNFRIGRSEYLVIEADEYKGAFLNYWPKIIILISIEKEHLDYYKNLRHIFKTFKEFINHLPEDGILVANKDDKNITKLIREVKKRKIKTIFYSLKEKESKKIKKTLKIPGDFNVSNALGVLAVARILGIPDKISLKVFSNYRGAWRRFEIFPASLNAKTYTLVSDYGHHPTQVKVTLKAAREKFPRKRIILVYQPHQIERTKFLFKEFVESFDKVDILILNEIFQVAGREKKKGKISSKKLAEDIQKRWQKLNYKKKIIKFIKNQNDIFRELTYLIRKGDVLIVMGAGDIYKLTLKLRSKNF